MVGSDLVIKRSFAKIVGWKKEELVFFGEMEDGVRRKSAMVTRPFIGASCEDREKS